MFLNRNLARLFLAGSLLVTTSAIARAEPGVEAGIEPGNRCYSATSQEGLGADLEIDPQADGRATFKIRLESDARFEFAGLKGFRFVEGNPVKCGPRGNAWCAEGIRYFTKERSFVLKLGDSGTVRFRFDGDDFEAVERDCENPWAP